MLMRFLWFQVVAIDRKNGYKLMSFQELSSRGRGSKDASITLDSIKVISCGSLTIYHRIYYVFVFVVLFSLGKDVAKSTRMST